MSKYSYSLLLASCCFGGSLLVLSSEAQAAPIPTFTADFGSASCSFSFIVGHVSGPGFDLGISAPGCLPFLGGGGDIPPGFDLQHYSLGPLPLHELRGPPVFPSGTVTVEGTRFNVLYKGDVEAHSTQRTGTLPSTPNPVVTFPAVMSGREIACLIDPIDPRGRCLRPEDPPSPTS